MRLPSPPRGDRLLPLVGLTLAVAVVRHIMTPIRAYGFLLSVCAYDSTERNEMRYLALVLKGMAYGVTHVVPGLGGAMILVLLGIYAQFVDTVGNLFIQRYRWREFLRFLIPLGLGMGLGIVLAAMFFAAALERFPSITAALFVGLLAGAIPTVWRMHEDMRVTPARILSFALCIALVIVLKSLESGSAAGRGQALTLLDLEQGKGIALNGLVSFLAGGASVMPGLDGSLVLILGGTYGPVLGAVSDLSRFVIHWGPLLSTGLGALMGILAFSRAVDALLKRSPSIAYYGVLGLVSGAIYALIPRDRMGVSYAALVLAGLVGLALARWLAYATSNDQTDQRSEEVAAHGSRS